MQDDPISNIIANIKDINERNEADTRHELDHEELIQSNLQTGEVVAKSFRSLVAYLENRISKTEVVNQLSSIGTPDVFAVVLALEELHNTLKTHENTDLTEVTNTMKGVLEEVSKLPKELPTFEQKDYVAQFDSLTNAIKSVEKVVKAQKLIAEAPKVTVEAPRITVEQNEVDISALENELQTSRKEFTKAIKSIVIPETDTKGIEKQLKSIDKLLNEFLDAPRGGGGGGSSSPTVFTGYGVLAVPVANPDGTPLSLGSSSVNTATSDGITVGDSSTTVLAINENRKSATIVNDSDETIYLKLGSGASLNSGIRINANGGSAKITEYTGVITAICVSGDKIVTVTEL